MSRKKKLSESQKLAIIAAYDKYMLAEGTAQKALEKVAEEWGVHWQTIRKIVHGVKRNRNIDEKQLSNIKDMQAEKLNKIINSILNDMDSSEKILKGLTPGQVPGAVGILIDKVLKLKGEDVTKIEINEIGEKVTKRLEELRSMRSALQQTIIVPEKPEDN